MELIVQAGERRESVHLEREGGLYRIRIGESGYEIDAARVGDGLLSLVVGGVQREVAVRGLGGGRYRVDGAEVEVLDPLAHLARESRGGAAGAGARQVSAYMPGRVVELLVAVGDEVRVGQGVLVLEAMKMENEIAAESAGTVSEIFVEAGQAVEGGDPLFELA